MTSFGIVAALYAAVATAPAPQTEPRPDPTPAPTAVPVGPSAVPVASAWTWSVNEEGVYRSWEDNGDTPNRREDLMDGMNRLIGVLTRNAFEVGAQLDIASASPADRAGLTDELALPPPGATTSVLFADDASEGLEYAVVLEKKFMRWSGGPATLEVGDTYRALGRGLALALVKNTELDIDTSLEGGGLDLRASDFEFSGFAGLSNPQTVSAAFSNQIRRDFRDLIVGGRVLYAGPVQLFAHGVSYRYDEQLPALLAIKGDLFEPASATVGGGGFSLPDFGGGLGDLYVEGVSVALDGKSLEGTARHYDGWGGYAAANLYLGPLTVTFEGKSYKNLELVNARQAEGTVPYDYSTPPTLEKENVVTYNIAKAVNSNDVHGGKASMSFPLPKKFLGRATYLRLVDMGHREETASGRIIDENESIHHGYLGLEKRGEGYFFQVTAGARNETRLEDPDVKEVLVHLDGDLLVPLYTGASLELKGLGYRQTEESARTDFQRTNDVTSFVVSVRPLRWASIAALVDTTTDERVTSGLGARPGNLSDQAFGAVELTVEPSDNTLARVFAGATQGGLKCSGGTCRVVPAFEGVRVEWLARF